MKSAGPTLDMNAYKLLWAMFYAQLDNYKEKGAYLRSADAFPLTDAELSGIKKGDIQVEATSEQFLIRITLPEKGQYYKVDHDGKFTIGNLK